MAYKDFYIRTNVGESGKFSNLWENLDVFKEYFEYKFNIGDDSYNIKFSNWQISNETYGCETNSEEIFGEAKAFQDIDTNIIKRFNIVMNFETEPFNKDYGKAEILVIFNLNNGLKYQVEFYNIHDGDLKHEFQVLRNNETYFQTMI